MNIPNRLSKLLNAGTLFTELGSGFIIEVGNFKYFDVSRMLDVWPKLVEKWIYIEEGLMKKRQPRCDPKKMLGKLKTFEIIRTHFIN